MTIAFEGIDSSSRGYDFGNGTSVQMLKRSNNSDDEEKYAIGRLLSPRDESIDVDDAQWKAALELARSAWHADPARQKKYAKPDEPSGPSIRRIRGFGTDEVPRHPEQGLLLLYALNPVLADKDSNYPQIKFKPEYPPIIAFGISFPGSSSGTRVKYKVNNVLWEQEYGPAD